MSKKKIQDIYITIITLITIAMFIKFFNQFGIVGHQGQVSLYDLLLWTVLAIIAETYIIISPSGVSTSVAIAIYIYIGIVANPFIVVLIATVGCLCKFPEIEGVKKHFFNSKKSTSFFNVSNLGLSSGAAALLFYYTIPINDKFNIFIVTIIAFVAILITELINFLLVSILLKITQGIQPKLIFISMIKTFPSSLAIGMLGIFLAFADDAYGKEIVLLFFIPLLLARYSFKLYFESQKMALETIHALNEALNVKDAYTGGHTGRVEVYSVGLAKAYGLPPADIEIIRTAALLHDIGKIGIPDSILNKPGHLTNEEFSHIKDHPTIGAKILGNVDSLKRVAQIIVQHHERYDGSGYPGQLAGSDILVEACILMISDSYDAMTTDRPYRKALSQEQAIHELVTFSGTQFHPDLTKCFVEKVLMKKQEDALGESEIA